jgi:hypothetical protein
MRNLCGAVLTIALINSAAFAAPAADGVLAAGRPAGIQAAQANTGMFLVVAGLAIVGVVALAMSSRNDSGLINNGTPTPTTTNTL